MVMATVMETGRTAAQPNIPAVADQLPMRIYRISLLLGGLAVAAAAGINAAANYYQHIEPDIALSLRPDDAVALTVREDRRLAGTDVTAAQASASAVAARQALRSEPLSTVALRQIGIADSFAGRSGEAFAIMRLSHRVSRREMGTLIWLVDNSISRNDPAAMLGYIDEALTTHSGATDVLVPALAAALFDPVVRSGVIHFLRVDRPWVYEFLARASSEQGAAAQAAGIVMASGVLGKSGSTPIDGRILTDLVQQGRFRLAATYIEHMARKGPNPSRDIRITPATTNPGLGPFGWTVIDRQNVGARWTGVDAIDVHAASDQRGVVLSRTLVLAAGDHMLSQALEAPTTGGVATATWQMSCLSPKAAAPFWIETARGSRPATLSRSVIHVPQGCEGQQIELVVSSDDDQGEASLTVKLQQLTMRKELGPTINRASISAGK